MSQPIGTFVLLGASGDLAGRLLMPALGQLLEAEPERHNIVLIGAGSEDWDNATWQQRVRSAFESGKVSSETIDAVLSSTRYSKADVTSADDLGSLIDAGPPAPALYFALPPAVAVSACKALQQLSLPEGTVLALEKPFGTDEASAASLNDLLANLVPETQVHRIDHFLGRSTVLNLLGVRFANRLLEPLWSNEHIERVDIVFDEELTLENRARYYDSAGALTDMIQSHLLQIVALVAMDPIAAVNARDLRDAKAQVLRACRPWRGDPAAGGKRARYTAGSIEGRDVPNYTDEPGVDPTRRHRNSGRAHRGDRQLAVGRGAIPVALGQSAGGTPERGADHVQTPASPANRSARRRKSRSAATGHATRPRLSRAEHERTG